MYLNESMVSHVSLVCIVLFSTSFSYARGVGLTENPPSQPDPIGTTGQQPGNIVYPPSQPNGNTGQPSGNIVYPPSQPNGSTGQQLGTIYPPSPQSFNIVGNWSGSPDCPITFFQDDGTNVTGNCNNGSFNHIMAGKYNGPSRIETTTTRIDPSGCQTVVRSSISVIDYNTVQYTQDGWNGCGVTTGPGGQVWSRR